MKNNNEIKKLNNKGFSLVELIIVIAIMAVLIGVLAPQYLRYVEKSRRSADATTVSEFVSAMSTLASDTSANLSTSETYTVTSGVNSDAVAISTDLAGNAVFASFIDVTATYTFKSQEFKKADITIALTYDTTDKVWRVAQNNVPNVD